MVNRNSVCHILRLRTQVFHPRLSQICPKLHPLFSPHRKWRDGTSHERGWRACSVLSECSVLRAPCSVLRAPCSVLRAPCSVPRAPCSVLSAQCSVPSAQCWSIKTTREKYDADVSTEHCACHHNFQIHPVKPVYPPLGACLGPNPRSDPHTVKYKM
jgi:hypothetical protein